MRDWLQRELRKIGMDIASAYLFGSSIHHDQNPNDIDLIIITIDGAGQPSWRRVIECRDDLKKRFDETFQIPLSVME